MSAPLERTRYAGVFRRGSKYLARYRDGQGVQRQQSGFRTAKLAWDWKRKRDAEISDGVWLGDSRIAFDEYAREWVESYTGRGRRGFRESTREDYRRALELYGIPYFSGRLGRTLAQISPRDVNQFVGWLCDEKAMGQHQVKIGLAEKPEPVALSDSRIRNIIAPVRSCLAIAVEDGLIRSNPADRVRLPNREHLAPEVDDDEAEDTRALTPAQLQAFFRAIEQKDRSRRGGQTHRILFEFLVATGLRFSEMRALRWRDLELSGQQPHVEVRWQLYRGRRTRPKSKYGRRKLPLPVELAQKLRRHRLATGRTGDEDLVFATIAGTPLDHSAMMRDAVRPAAKAIGEPWITFHTFRHTCASMLFAQGRNAVQVQRWLGHHSPAFTLARYVHLLDNELAEALEVTAPGEQLRLREVVDDA